MTILHHIKDYQNISDNPTFTLKTTQQSMTILDYTYIKDYPPCYDNYTLLVKSTQQSVTVLHFH